MLAGKTHKRYASTSYRVRHPSELLERVSPLLPAAGVTRIANITGLDRIGIPTVSAIRPAGSTLSVVAGKGISLEDATASASMEAIEFFCAETVSLPIQRCAAAAMEGPVVLPDDGVPLRRHALVRPNAPMTWTFGFDLVQGTPCAVPADLVSLAASQDATSPFPQTSNGLASGAVQVEALLAALLEVTERDAYSCWSFIDAHSGVCMPRVRLETLGDMPRVQDLLQQFAAAQVQPIVYDCAVDTRIPVYVVRLVDLARRNVGVFFGSGAHLDAEIALVRALTEAAQSRAVYIAGSRDDLSGREFAQLRAHDSPSIVATLLAQPAGVDARRYSASSASSTLERDCQYVIQRLCAVGVQRVVVVDLTPAAFRESLAVVRVVAPGLACPGAPPVVLHTRTRTLLRQVAA